MLLFTADSNGGFAITREHRSAWTFLMIKMSASEDVMFNPQYEEARTSDTSQNRDNTANTFVKGN